METLQKSGIGEEYLGHRKELCGVGEDLQNSGQLLWLVLGTQDSHKIV